MRSVEVAESPAMGSTARVCVGGRIPGGACGLIDELGQYERLWSRFDDHSEISSVPSRVWTTVSSETFALLDRCHQAWKMSSGTFDASMGQTLAERGYRHQFVFAGRGVCDIGRDALAASIGVETSTSVELPGVHPRDLSRSHRWI